jgi:type II secretory pathway pseudopilin PulG
VIERLRREDGFGLLELVFAILVLNIVILALFATFNAGSLALRRASEKSTAETLGDKQLELYRSLTYHAIGLHSSLVPGDSMHTGDAAAAQTQFTNDALTGCTATAVECKPTQTLSSSSTPASPDGHTYRIDTYITQLTGGNAPVSGRTVKQVTVVVRRADNKVLARLTSNFDQATGCVGAVTCTSA